MQVSPQESEGPSVQSFCEDSTVPQKLRQSALQRRACLCYLGTASTPERQRREVRPKYLLHQYNLLTTLSKPWTAPGSSSLQFPEPLITCVTADLPVQEHFVHHCPKWHQFPKIQLGAQSMEGAGNTDSKGDSQHLQQPHLPLPACSAVVNLAYRTWMQPVPRAFSTDSPGWELGRTRHTCQHHAVCPLSLSHPFWDLQEDNQHYFLTGWEHTNCRH